MILFLSPCERDAQQPHRVRERFERMFLVYEIHNFFNVLFNSVQIINNTCIFRIYIHCTANVLRRTFENY